jgi:hypothetical protein
LRIDSDDAILVDSGQAVPESVVMALRIDGTDHEPMTAQAAIDKLTADRDAIKGALAVERTKTADLQKRCDAAEDPKRVAVAVKERVSLLESIRKGNEHYLRADADEPPAEPDGGSDPIALMTEALMAWQPGLDLKGATPDMVMGAFKAMMASVTGDEASEPPAQDALARPAPNTAPEMELNGKRRGDGRTSPGAQARRALHADAGGMRHDGHGYPDTGNVKRELNAEERQRADNANRYTQPMHDTKGT